MQQLIEIEKKFYALAEDLYPSNETAADFLASIWQNDRALAKSAITKIIIDLGEKPRITDAIVQMILDISCLEMDEFCFEISSKRKCPPLSKMLINSCLLYRNFEKAIRNIDKTVQRGCQLFLKGGMEESAILALVQQACILRRKNLGSDILNMIHAIEEGGKSSPYIHIIDRKSIEVVAQGMLLGWEYLKSVLADNKSQTYEKVAAVFSLGCERDQFLYSYLSQIFFENYKDTRRTNVCTEIIGAIVYSAADENIINFLIENLEMFRKDMRKIRNRFALLPGHHHYITKRLLEACAYFKTQNKSLCDELYQWLEISKKDIQVHALLALENFGVTHHELSKTLREEIKYEKFFRQDCIMFTDLLILRYTVR
ncbi:MAG: hypothetical protein LBE13_04305 [Bacteroidales bacterium]|jgi:hypothetical protein|nr:hypothetical protein [Bacteroidales bacterium]